MLAPMKSRTLLLLLFTAAATPVLQAQNVGFRVAIAPPAQPVQQPFPTANVMVNSPVQPFISAPVQPYGFGQQAITPFGFGVTPHMVPPIITTSYSPIFSYPNPPQPVVQPYVVAGVPGNGVTIITRSVVVFQQPPAQAYAIAPRTGPAPALAPPAIGTPRIQVIQQLGIPLTSVYTQAGETLFFSGGVQIFIQNDKVARPN